MINEGEAGEEGEAGIPGLPGEGPGDALDQPGVIQVSPQDKEAIERVKIINVIEDNYKQFFFSAESPWIPRTSRSASLFRLRKEREPGSKLPTFTEL